VFCFRALENLHAKVELRFSRQKCRFIIDGTAVGHIFAKRFQRVRQVTQVGIVAFFLVRVQRYLLLQIEILQPFVYRGSLLGKHERLLYEQGPEITESFWF